MKLLRTTALTAALMTAAVTSFTGSAQAQAALAWGWRGGGWGWPGASVGSLATEAAVGSAAARNYSYGYGYPAYSYGYPAYSYGYPAYSYGYGYGSGYSYPAQARLAWWGWPGLVTAGAAAPGYAYGYGTSYGYPASRYYSSSGGYGMWENPWYSAAYHPVIRRPIAFSRPRIRPMYAAGAGVRRHWQ